MAMTEPVGRLRDKGGGQFIILYIGVGQHPVEQLYKELKPIDKIGISALYHVNAEVYSQHEQRQQVGADQSQSHTPQCSPPAIAKELLVSDIGPDIS